MSDFLLKVCRQSGLRLPFLGAVALVFLLGTSSVSQAAPVTFRFEAEVIDVDVLAPADLPFTVENGNILKGQFTFEPIDAQPGPATTITDTIQELGFSVRINTTVVSSSKYVLRVWDNFPVIDAASFVDNISLQTCTALDDPQCQPETIPGSDDIAWGFSLALSADASVLDGPDISDDLSVWHQFVPRHFVINLTEVGVGDVLRVKAQVTSISMVPEPSSFCLVLLFCIGISAKRHAILGK